MIPAHWVQKHHSIWICEAG